MRAADIESLISVGRPTIAADGAFAVFATSRPDLEANRGVGQLWRAELPDGPVRRLTRGTADASPVLSPDGESLAFLRADGKGKPQIHVVRAAGGEAVQATDQRGGVSAFAWSPDGRRLGFVSRVLEEGRYGTVEGLGAEAESPRRVTGIRWHANGLGYLAGRPAHLFVIDAPDLESEPFYEAAPAVRPGGEQAPSPRIVAADAVQLTRGEESHYGVVFSADGSEIFTVPDAIESTHRDLRSTIVAVSVDGGAQREVLSAAHNLSVDDMVVAADGTVAVIAADVGASGVDFVAPGSALWLLDGEAPRPLTDPETLDLGEVGSHISVIGDDFLVQNRSRGRVELLRVTRSGAMNVVFGGDVEVSGHAAVIGTDGSEDRVVVAHATPTSFGELTVVGGSTLTDFGADLRSHGIVEPIEREITGRDGYPVHGWVAVPEGEGPFPVILQIHGGPYASYGIHVFDETQVLVDAGYAVVYSNPRGSAGYGREHGRSIRQEMGTVDHEDVIDFLDAALEADPRLDAGRVGIMGGSYGGYLTAWIIAHDYRFRGAIVERGFLDPVSFQGTSDIGSFFGDEYVGDDPDLMDAQSPMSVVDRVVTPTLVLHSELDFRCPLEQATRYYMALKRQGTPTEMLIFPGEDHELTRGGQPRHRRERFEAVLEWWSRYLPVS